MAAAIEAAHPGIKVDNKPGGKGDFIVTADNQEIWNKMAHPDQRFPEHDEILPQLASNA